MLGKYTHYVRPVWSKSTADDKFVEDLSEAEVEQWMMMRRRPRLVPDDAMAALAALDRRIREGKKPFSRDDE